MELHLHCAIDKIHLLACTANGTCGLCCLCAHDLGCRCAPDQRLLIVTSMRGNRRQCASSGKHGSMDSFGPNQLAGEPAVEIPHHHRFVHAPCCKEGRRCATLAIRALSPVPVQAVAIIVFGKGDRVVCIVNDNALGLLPCVRPPLVASVLLVYS